MRLKVAQAPGASTRGARAGILRGFFAPTSTMRFAPLRQLAGLALAVCALAAQAQAQAQEQAQEQEQALSNTRIVAATDRVVLPLMRAQRIPGMAVGIVAGGRSYVVNYGVASSASGAPVDDATLFEVGSVTKNLTALLAAWAVARQRLRLDDRVERHLPRLRGTAFGKVRVLELATHTPGGLPLQLPEDIRTQQQLDAYLAAWKPACRPGTCRTYSNLATGMLGEVTARSLHLRFRAAVQGQLLPALGMRHSYLDLPRAEIGHYALGTTHDGRPARMHPGLLADESYGLRTTATDLLRYLRLQLDPRPLPASLRAAVALTQTGYFQAGVMTQDLVWEQVPCPAGLHALLEANSPAMIFDAVPARRLVPPLRPDPAAWIDKTGATNGFSAYVAMVPALHVGIVLLANRNIPIDAQVKAAYAIVRSLAPSRASSARDCASRSRMAEL